MVNVVFFYDHSQDDILAENCFLYADRMPGRNAKSDDFKKAQQVNAMWIQVKRIRFFFI